MQRRALVTGGTRGLGAAVARELLAHGFEVHVTGTRAGGRGPEGTGYLACDFSSDARVDALAEKARRLEVDVLVNNAGINKVGELEGYDAEDFALLHTVNVLAPFKLCAAVVPGMRRRRFGRIVNITSVFGVVSRAGRSAYSASKFGLFGLSRALALETASDNVLVNCLAPGFVDTDLTRRILGPKGMRRMARLVPLGRLARPEEIARYARFLASEENSYMTGQNVVVDGGYVSA